MPANTLASFLEVSLRSRGWSRRALADRARISPNTLANLLDCDDAKPQSGTLRKIADALGVTPDGLAALAKASARFDGFTNPAVARLAIDNAALFKHWTPEEWDELISSFGVGGELTDDGVSQAAREINARRETIRQVMVLLETHLADNTRTAIQELYQQIAKSD